MKSLIKDFFSTLLRYFLVYYALYVIVVLILTLFSFPLYIKNTILTVISPVYGIFFMLFWMKRQNMDRACVTTKPDFNHEFMDDTVAVFGINIGLSWMISLIIGLFTAVEGNIDISELLANPVLSLLVNGLLVPIDEELFFRVFLMNSLEKHGRWKAAIIISIFFGLAHINPLVVIFAFVISMCMFALRFKHHSIWPCVLVHVFVNTFNQLSALTENSMNPADIVLIGAVFYGIFYLYRNRKTIKSEFIGCFKDYVPNSIDNEMCSE